MYHLYESKAFNLSKEDIQMGKRIKDEVKEEIIRLYNDGLIYREISDKSGVTSYSIAAVIRNARENNLITRAPHTTVKPIKDVGDSRSEKLRKGVEIMKMLESGFSVAEISNKADVDWSTIYKYIKQIKMTSSSKPEDRSSNYDKEILELLNLGYSPYKIAKKVNVPLSDVYSYILSEQRNGNLVRYGNFYKYSIDESNKVIELYNANYTVADIANSTNMPESAIYRIIKIYREKTDLITRLPGIHFYRDIAGYNKCIDMIKDGYSRREIANEFNTSIAAINGFIAKAKASGDLPKERINKIPDDVKQKIVDLYNKNYKYDDIAKELDMSVVRIMSILSCIRRNDPSAIPSRKKHK